MVSQYKFFVNFFDPYVELMRLSTWRPAFLVVSPALFSCIFYANEVPWTLWFFILYGGYLMRTIGCVWNAISDAHIDGCVRRTCQRPLPSGWLAVWQAGVLLAVLLGCGVCLMLWFMPLWWLGVGCLILSVLYCYSKRWSYCAHLFLGCAVGLGVFVPPMYLNLPIGLGHIALYCGAVMWALVYDTIYGLQDYHDDMVLGLRGTHILVFGCPDLFVYLIPLWLGAIAMLLMVAGWHFGMGVMYHAAGACAWFWCVHKVRAVSMHDIASQNTFFKKSVLWYVLWGGGGLMDRLLNGS